MSIAPQAPRRWTEREMASGRYTAQAAQTLKLGKPSQHASLRLLASAGNRLLAGTDAGYPGIVPGRSLHDELAQFVAGGLSPFQALAISCERGPRFLGMAATAASPKARAPTS
ncbi:MAG TPA: hypothetical protein VGN91_04255 [Bosea sp. (in: a-proteobacteria)]|jgi:imidazolonepropionase-like amidohydrolase|nr:hypothetical protein [Bosea sp. (in: a-proteobacteria)]